MKRRYYVTAAPLVVTSFILCQLSSARRCADYEKSFLSSYSVDRLIGSVNYPFDYPPSTTCLLSLERPSSLAAVKLSFTTFSLEVTSGCTDDYVEIRDGDKYSSSTLIGRFCGSRLPPIIVSNYKYLFVKFVSDSDYYPSRRKFLATYRAIQTVRSSGRCSLNSPFLHNNNLQLTSSSGTFRSPSYPSYYPNNMICTWKITVPSGKRIKLYFDSFQLESGVCSANDYLEIRDGSSSTSLKKGTYCGSYASTVTSSGRHLWVRFRSDSAIGYKGFQARYEVISKSSNLTATLVGVLVGIGVIVAIIAIAIYLIKRKNRRVVTTQPLATTTTTAMTTNPPPPAGFSQHNPQQQPYPQAPAGPPLPPTGVQPGPPPLGTAPAYPHGGPYQPPQGVAINPAYGAYGQPLSSSGVMPGTQAPPPYYPTEGMKGGPPAVVM